MRYFAYSQNIKSLVVIESHRAGAFNVTPWQVLYYKALQVVFIRDKQLVVKLDIEYKATKSKSCHDVKLISSVVNFSNVFLYSRFIIPRLNALSWAQCRYLSEYPVTDEVRPRVLRLVLYAKSGELISGAHELIFDSSSESLRSRE